MADERAVDHHVQPLGHVPQHLLVVHGRRQPRQDARHGPHGHAGDGGQLGPPRLGLADRVAQGVLGLRGAVDADDDALDGPGDGIGASSGSVLPSSRSGTTTVGQYACAGRADETVPSSRSANPPRPRVPTTASRTVCDISTSTPAASP